MSGPLLMGEAANLGARVTESSGAIMGATLGLMRRRGYAVVEYWETAARTWEPEERLALQMGYLKQMADDYTAAVSEALTPWAEVSEAVIQDFAPADPEPAPQPIAEPPPVLAAPELAPAPAPEPTPAVEPTLVEAVEAAPEPKVEARVEPPKTKAAKRAESPAAPEEGRVGEGGPGLRH